MYKKTTKTLSNQLDKGFDASECRGLDICFLPWDFIKKCVSLRNQPNFEERNQKALGAATSVSSRIKSVGTIRGFCLTVYKLCFVLRELVIVTRSKY